jgi:hypothetical protein
MNRATRYALGLLVEEMGEALCHIGRALRFGLDTLGQDGISEREGLERELGDVRAAVDFSAMNSVVATEVVHQRRSRKLSKLTDPSEKDNLGRRLAPQFGDFLEPSGE